MLIRVLIAFLVVWIGYLLFNDPFKPELVQGKRVLVTGASQGIGEHLTYHYCRFGCSVVITSRSEGKLQKVKTKCESLGGKAYVITGDMLDTQTPAKLHKFTVEKLGGLDQLVLNHMLPFDMSMWTHSDNMTILREIYQVNVHAFIELATRFRPQLISSSGGVTVVNSIAGIMPTPSGAAYSSSKHALIGFFESLRLENHLQDVNVSITLAYLGLIGTDSAMKRIERVSDALFTRYVPAADVGDTALAIVQQSALRANQMYYPRSAAVVHYVRDLLPYSVMKFYAELYRP